MRFFEIANGKPWLESATETVIALNAGPLDWGFRLEVIDAVGGFSG
jgi:hypothetical protein